MGNRQWKIESKTGEIDNDKLTIGNGDLKMDNLKQLIGNGRWEMDNGKQTIGNGKWTMRNQEQENSTIRNKHW